MVQLDDQRCQQADRESDLGVLEDLSIIGVEGQTIHHHRGFHSIYEHLPSSVLRTFIHSLAYQYLLATLYASTLRLSNDGALTYR